MHTYMKSKTGTLWEVGFFEPKRTHEGTLYYEWHPVRAFPDEPAAAAYASYLNGSDHLRKPFPEENGAQ